MKTQMIKKLSFAAAIAGLGIAMAMPVHAAFKLTLTPSGGGAVTVTDGGVGDSNPDVGAITFIGSLTGWSVNVTTGLSKPVLGSATVASMDLNSVNVSSAGGGSLTIELTDTDFNALSPTSFSMSIGGTTNGSVTYDAYIDAGNVEFGQGTLVGNLGPYAPIAFSGSTAGGGPFAGGPFSMTQVVTITHAGATSSSFDAELRAVPEPGTLALFGMSILGFGIGLRRRLGRAA